MISVYSGDEYFKNYPTDDIEVDEAGNLKIYKSESPNLLALYSTGKWERVEWTYYKEAI